MSESLGVATLELEGDGTRLDRQLKDFERKAGESAKRGGAQFKAGIQKATLPAIAALGLVVLGVKKTTDASIDLGESQNAVNVVFGDAATKIHRFAKIAAEEAGLSMRALNELVTPVGAALQNAGFSADEAADASINLAKRAADMASVFNVDVDEALGAIQAGLRGEADPLERFGVGLNETAVKAEGVRLGLANAKGELDANGKMQARLSLVMKQTNKLQGDFKNTSDEAANAQRVQAAESENTQAKIGKGLVPVVKMYRDLIAEVTGFLGDHTGATKIAAGVIAGLAIAVLAVAAAMKVYAAGQIVATAAVWLFNLALAANPVVLIVIGIVALAAALILAYKKFETFRNIVDAGISFIKNHWDILLLTVGILPGLFVLLWRRSETFRTIVTGAIGAVRDAFGWIIDKARLVIGFVKDRLAPAFRTAFGWMADKVQTVVGWVENLIEKLQTAWDWLGKVTPNLGGGDAGNYDGPTMGDRGNPRRTTSFPTIGGGVPAMPIVDGGDVGLGASGVYEVHLTDWEEGKGFIRRIADGSVADQVTVLRQQRRMGG